MESFALKTTINTPSVLVTNGFILSSNLSVSYLHSSKLFFPHTSSPTPSITPLAPTSTPPFLHTSHFAPSRPSHLLAAQCVCVFYLLRLCLWPWEVKDNAWSPSLTASHSHGSMHTDYLRSTKTQTMELLSPSTSLDAPLLHTHMHLHKTNYTETYTLLSLNVGSDLWCSFCLCIICTFQASKSLRHRVQNQLLT